MAAYTAYDPTKDENYQKASTNKANAIAAKPLYKNTYAQAIDDQYNNIVNREKFSYDVNEDAMFRQYKDNYVKQGQLAMRDTMGQAAALTGGYGSSYGQAVGQQQFNAYLQQLNDVVPELYQMAYQQYQDEGQNLMNQYSMTRDLADDEYSKYQDENANYWSNVNYWANEENTAYNRGLAQSDKAYDAQQEAYSKLSDLVLNYGYVPNTEDLEEAGMSAAEYNVLKAYYNKMNPVESASVSNGGGGSGGLTAWQAIKKDLDDGVGITDINSQIVNSGLSISEKTDLAEKASKYASSTGKVSEKQKYDEKYGYW